jgi:starch phosphorylase
MNPPHSGSKQPVLEPMQKPDLLRQDIQRHIMSNLGNDYYPPRKDTYYKGLAYSLRHRLIQKWIQTQRAHYAKGSKRVYYLSMEFLPGRFLMNYITNLQMETECRDALEGLEFTLEDLEEEEWDAGLGNGGLGRLASCFMDSMATLGIPGYGYGLRYDYGIFFQTIVNGYQVEQCDNWVRYGCPWEIKRRGFLYKVKFYGRTESYTDADGKPRRRWIDTQTVMAMASDLLIPGFDNGVVTNMRLWEAVSSREFNLEEFNQGDYIGAVEAKVLTENISKVLYPRDEAIEGKELRLKQQYFFVAATFKDMLRRFKKEHTSFAALPDAVAVQLNDTHPSIAIAELMRLLIDKEGLEWDAAWQICQATFAYTNHTVLPEAMETWPVDLIGRLLPRHLEIIYEINQRFLDTVRNAHPNNPDLPGRVSLIADGPSPQVRMAHLAIVGSHSVNGVAALHSRILKEDLFQDFDLLFPGRIRNVTNGITPRRWLLQANPGLSRLIGSVIGSKWICDLNQLKQLIPFANDPVFRSSWRALKKKNKERLVRYIHRKTELTANPDSLFDVHVKRIHEYKRQLLNVLHIITRYNRIKANFSAVPVARTVIFAGKAAPGYVQAKLIIKLINSVADTINGDPDMKDRLQVIFLPNYCVSQAEKIITGTDLSEQISTAGLEASGTGNMKFALNGALTIGTLDGANVEIMEEVGAENIFIFGLKAPEVKALRASGYEPRSFYEKDPELKTALDMIGSDAFSPGQAGLFSPIINALLDRGDHYMVLADYRSYIQMQDRVDEIFTDVEEWTRRSILNTANMGKFSSDRAISQYAVDIWGVTPEEPSSLPQGFPS